MLFLAGNSSPEITVELLMSVLTFGVCLHLVGSCFIQITRMKVTETITSFALLSVLCLLVVCPDFNTKPILSLPFLTKQR